jgi:hypothetical protein
MKQVAVKIICNHGGEFLSREAWRNIKNTQIGGSPALIHQL